MSIERCDVAIVGAGMVGAALAALLVRSGLNIMVIEAGSIEVMPRRRNEGRVSALNAAAERILAAAGAWQAILADGACPYREMHVWDAVGAGSIHFDSADIGEARLGYIVDNQSVVDALIARLRGATGLRLRPQARVSALSQLADEVFLDLDDGSRISARLVVGADGAGSHVRRLSGLEVLTHDYEQRAIVASVTTELPHHRTAWQRFLPTGPLAFLPLADGRCSIVWSTSVAHAEALLAMDEQSFRQELGAAFDHRLGLITACGPRAAFPLRRQHATRYVAPRVALVGDAAHVVHPLAGQGANLGFLDAAALAEVVTDAAARSADIGSSRVLRRYERWRKGDNLATMWAMDGFKRLFSSPVPALRVARSAGLGLTDALTPVKHVLVRRAMGLCGDLPALARGAAL